MKGVYKAVILIKGYWDSKWTVREGKTSKKSDWEGEWDDRELEALVKGSKELLEKVDRVNELNI